MTGNRTGDVSGSFVGQLCSHILSYFISLSWFLSVSHRGTLIYLDINVNGGDKSLNTRVGWDVICKG